MKKYLLGIVVILIFWSCNDSYLEKYPLDSLTEKTAFVTAENFRTFSWSFYGALTISTGSTSTERFYRHYNVQQGLYNGDFLAGYLGWRNKNVDGNQMRTQLKVTGASGNGWDFTEIRRCNLMLQNIDGSQMSEADKEHYRSVGYFFRAFSYYELISRFGDVPWIDQVIQENDTDIIYGSRTPRKEVADHLMADLQWAETHIKPTGDGANSINTDVVRALMSRFFLFEGTWRKYHGLGDADKYLDECIRVSQLLATKYPSVSNNYDALLNSLDLSKHPGMILYKQYEAAQITHNTNRYEKSAALSYDMPHCTVENYLCSDGRPVSTSTVYQGDKSMFKEFRNRDYRLLATVVPPYSLRKRIVGGKVGPDYSDASPAVYNPQGYYSGDADVTDNMEFNEVLKTAFPGTTKRVPSLWLDGSSGAYNSPNIIDVGVPQIGSYSGYTLWKNYNTFDDMDAGQVTDKPIFWIEEVLLNLAEASWEKNQFTQAIADATINKLRPRAGVSNMVIADIDAGFDTNRDQTVDPVLWEIRRERQSELMGMGFGFQDIRRWKKGPWYVNRPQTGVYVTRANWKSLDANGNVTENNAPNWANATTLPLVNKDFTVATDAGYVKRFDDPTKIGKGWLDKYYLEWIPTNQIVLNPNIIQNPGW